jgi:hypothetical protein
MSRHTKRTIDDDLRDSVDEDDAAIIAELRRRGFVDDAEEWLGHTKSLLRRHVATYYLGAVRSPPELEDTVNVAHAAATNLIGDRKLPREEPASQI